MKKIFLLITIAIVAFSCKNTEEKDIANDGAETENTENNQTYRGEFLYIADAAVLKGDNFIYGVTLDAKSQELADRVEPIKNDDFDMVQVIVSGVVSKKPEGTEGWEEIITIKEILTVSNKPSEADIKIEDKKS